MEFILYNRHYIRSFVILDRITRKLVKKSMSANFETVNCLNHRDEPVLMAVRKPMLTEFGIHYQLESCESLT